MQNFLQYIENMLDEDSLPSYEFTEHHDVSAHQEFKELFPYFFLFHYSLPKESFEVKLHFDYHKWDCYYMRIEIHCESPIFTEDFYNDVGDILVIEPIDDKQFYIQNDYDDEHYSIFVKECLQILSNIRTYLLISLVSNMTDLEED